MREHTSYSLRPLESSDLPAVAEISMLGVYSDWSFETFTSCFKENYLNLVLVDEHEVLGFLISTLNVDEIEILNLGIHPAKWRQGLADFLLSSFIEFARQHQVQRIHLEVNKTNLPAIALYQKHHFAQVGSRQNYYAAKEGAQDALLFSLELNS